MNSLTKLSPLQKVILMYIGITTKRSERKYMKRTDVTIGLNEILAISNKDSFSVILTNSINSLQRRELTCRMRNSIGITNLGRQVAKETISDITEMYGRIDWEIMNDWYEKKWKKGKE